MREIVFDNFKKFGVGRLGNFCCPFFSFYQRIFPFFLPSPPSPPPPLFPNFPNYFSFLGLFFQFSSLLFLPPPTLLLSEKGELASTLCPFVMDPFFGHF